jgi:hypothetical protein
MQIKHVITFLGISLLLFNSIVYSQDSERDYFTQLTEQSPRIDGILDDEAWKGLPEATDFLQTIPYNGKKATYPTSARITYDNTAIYVGAFMYDPNPDSILTGLAHRDANDSELNADLFIVELNPYNDDQMLFAFKLSASNVQVDERVTFNNWDKSWDGIWYSETHISDSGWSAEIKIPYSTLRIPNSEKQVWGLHLWRCIKRYEEWLSWNFVDEKVQGTVHQVGELHGIENIEPPVRLSVTPYFSVYGENSSSGTSSWLNETEDVVVNDVHSSSWTKAIKGGLDLKYGINESYTLDMMLIPDFGQVQSDDIVHNYTTVETYYNENRQFFTENTELFSRAGLFYSRRIGAQPKGYGGVMWGTAERGDSLIENPGEAQILNAIKVSGRSANGTAIGVLNAITANTFAEYIDTLGEKQKEKTQPFTNYNVLVVDQALKNNSFISIIRTNVRTPNWNYIANVTGTEFMFSNKKNSYNITGSGAVSEIISGEPETGYYTNLQVNKTSGNFRFHIHNQIYEDEYNPTDLGYLARNNIILSDISTEYNIIDPFWKILSLYNSLSVNHEALFNPQRFIMTEFHLSSNATFQNQFRLHIGAGLKPFGTYDYFEPRVPGWRYYEPESSYGGFSIGTDRRKTFSLSGELWRWQTHSDNMSTFIYGLSPSVRVNDRFVINGSYNGNLMKNSYGFETKTDENDTIIFARRDISEQTAVLAINYIFTSKMALSIRGRFYRNRIEKHDFYLLNKDGSVNKDYVMQHTWQHENRNNFNVDLIYTWQFAPGSELSVAWKNSINYDDDNVSRSYFGNLDRTWRTVQNNSLSIKMLYYLDYWNIKNSGK